MSCSQSLLFAKFSIPLERSAWDAGAAALAPGRRFRFALLAPRLVAPHRNRGYGEAIDDVEATALVVQARVFDLDRLAEQHQSIPAFYA